MNLVLALAGCILISPTQVERPRPDSANVAALVESFHAALRAGDSLAAMRHLATDAVILESGGIETRDEYRSHHLRDDIQFAQAVASRRSIVRVTVIGDAAWIASTTTTNGAFNGRAINSSGAELVALRKESGAWKIAAIHWSSRTRRTTK